MSISDAIGLAAAFIYEQFESEKHVYDARQEWLGENFPTSEMPQDAMEALDDFRRPGGYVPLDRGEAVPDDRTDDLDDLVARAQQAARERAVESQP